MKVALDTNILIYAEGLQGETRRDETLHLLRTLAGGALVVPVQVLGEVFNVLVRKAGRTRAEAAAVVAAWSDAAETQDTGADVMVRALDLARDHQFGIWDAVILAAAATAGCRLLLSEDLHHGFTWGGVTVLNPYVLPRHPLLEALATHP